MPRRSRLYSQVKAAFVGCALSVCAVVMVGCGGGPRLAPTPSSPVNLSGHWVLEVGASDDAQALIRAALPRIRELRRARYDLWGNEVREGAEPDSMPPGTDRRSSRSGQGGDGDRGFTSREAVPAWGRFPPFEFVGHFALPSKRLDIQQDARTVRVGVDARGRAFIAGDDEPINLTDRYGSRALRGGWVADAFVVSSDDGKHVRVVDSVRYTRDDRIHRILEVHVTGVKTITIHAQYRRATEAELSAAADEGPPAPNR